MLCQLPQGHVGLGLAFVHTFVLIVLVSVWHQLVFYTGLMLQYCQQASVCQHCTKHTKQPPVCVHPPLAPITLIPQHTKGHTWQVVATPV